ncbi:hypothetical protein OMP38_19430 [Cohnella ginsengisoli]|uniref:Uncharacterized protein n=1 Tax=Cohnella ginsengisoli TaxID=425004 RepID=A0A9X4QPJ0_9BACL|nr:hypothetical protein [Cohnella ginsengisoli]MDG0792800.1 hypothetical protein [Cohnella ginsengisoli]
MSVPTPSTARSALSVPPFTASFSTEEGPVVCLIDTSCPVLDFQSPANASFNAANNDSVPSGETPLSVSALL